MLSSLQVSLDTSHRFQLYISFQSCSKVNEVHQFMEELATHKVIIFIPLPREPGLSSLRIEEAFSPKLQAILQSSMSSRVSYTSNIQELIYGPYPFVAFPIFYSGVLLNLIQNLIHLVFATIQKSAKHTTYFYNSLLSLLPPRLPSSFLPFPPS